MKVDASLGAMLVGSERHPSGSLGKCLYVKDFGMIQPPRWDFWNITFQTRAGDPEWGVGGSQMDAHLT